MRKLAVFAVWIAIATLQCVSAQEGTSGARKFDEFGDEELSSIAARLDNYAIALANEPQKKGFLIVYRSRRDLPGLSSSLVAWLKYYLVENRRLSQDRIVAIDGGVAGCIAQELWLVPPGSAPVPRSDAYNTRFEDTDSPRKYFEASRYAEDFGGESYEFDIRNSFEGFAEALRRESKSRAYLVAYAGFRVDDLSEFNDKGIVTRRQRRVVIEPVSSAWKGLAEYKAMLAREYRIPALRIKTIFGGYRSWPMMELWIVPSGSHEPIPTPNRFPKARR